jgi:putative DNA-invertase from lambdoid prophage Rac
MENQIVGYGRISTNLQNMDVQKEQLEEIGINYFVSETISTSKKLKDRKLWDLINGVNSGTTIITVALDRIARNTMEILEILEICKERSITIKTIREGLVLEKDIKPEQEMVISVLGSIAQMERKTIQNRVKKGLETAKKNGIPLGRQKGQVVKSKLDVHKNEIVKLLNMKLPVRKIKKILELKVSVSEMQLGKYIKKHKLRDL